QNNKNKSKEKENIIKKSEESNNLGTQINNNLKNTKHSNTNKVNNINIMLIENLNKLIRNLMKLLLPGELYTKLKLF
ncbi:hypothetical protein, partial [Borreliella garinii]|uniref:hypothetical protein n=1 Tax=Borreliella garinii TaxID=29519 RepID=UPI001AEFF68F